MALKYQLLRGAHDSCGKVRGRYAPSPTGEQHLGNVQAAILAWLQARLVGGSFVLRMDDIDTPRVKAGSAEEIIEDLRWLGLDWDVLENVLYQADKNKIYWQSQQLQHYQKAFQQLLETGNLYACACSRKAIREQVEKPNEAGHYVYPGTCRHKAAAFVGQDKAASWRFKLMSRAVKYQDEIAGEQVQNSALECGDFVVKRVDGLFAYQFVSVVDDIVMGITDVLRGVDLLDSTPSQIALFEALGKKAPRFWHAPLRQNEAGEKLSKRNGSVSLSMLRKQGYLAEQVIGDTAFELGLIDRNEKISLQDLYAELVIA